MSVSSCSSTGSGAASAAQRQSQIVDQIFKKADANRDGQITKTELTQALESDTVKLSPAAASAKVDQVFQQLDSTNKGYLTKGDVAAGLQKAAPQGAPPAGGPHKGRRGGGGGDGGAATTTASTDPADTNQDGKVSAAEEMAYVQKQYASSSSSTPAPTVDYPA